MAKKMIIIPSFSSDLSEINKIRPGSSKIHKITRVREGIRRLLGKDDHPETNKLTFFERNAKTDLSQSDKFSQDMEDKNYWDTKNEFQPSINDELRKLLFDNKKKIKEKLKEIEDRVSLLV
jgi:hypothetical protein